MVVCDISVVIPNEGPMPRGAIHENRESAQRHREQTNPKTRSAVPLHRVAIVFREMGTLSRTDIREQVLYFKGCAGLLVHPCHAREFHCWLTKLASSLPAWIRRLSLLRAS